MASSSSEEAFSVGVVPPGAACRDLTGSCPDPAPVRPRVSCLRVENRSGKGAGLVGDGKRSKALTIPVTGIFQGARKPKIRGNGIGLPSAKAGAFGPWGWRMP